jgi:hypothetical protein
MRLLALLLLAACGSQPTRHVNATDAISLRERLRNQAFTCDGLPAQDTTYWGRQHCGIGDQPLYQGLGCLAGEERYCKPPMLTELDSRDMVLGAVAYLAKTNDAAYRLEARKHFAALPKRVCFDACDRTPIIQDLMSRVGISDGGRLAESVIGFTLYNAALTAPEGYQLRLIADEVVIYRKLGVNISSKIAKNLYRRQTCNSYFRFLAYGSFDLSRIDVVPNVNKTRWLFSDSCSDMDRSRSNYQMELYLINLVINGV